MTATASTPGIAHAIRTPLDTAAIWAGLVGAGTIGGVSIVAGVTYRGAQGEPYGPVNHWVSELGELGVSQLAWLFDVGLVVGGLLFVVFMVGLAATQVGRLRFAYGALGVVAGLAGAGVGVFPMNQREAHALMALTFFDLGWIVVALASIDFWRAGDRRFPRWLSAVGALTVVAFVAFLVTLRIDRSVTADALASPEARPEVWVAPMLEWAVIVGIVSWVFLTAAAWWRATR